MKKLLALALVLALTLGAAGAMAETVLKLGIYPIDTDERGVETHENTFIPAFEAAHPDVTIERAPYDFNLQTILPLLESGNAPSVITTYFTEIPKLAGNDFLEDITDILEERGWLEQINPAIIGPSSYEGRVYGIPRNFYGMGMMLNVELFEEAGLVDEDGTPLYPKTWDEFVETAAKIKDETGAAGFVLLGADNAAGWHFTILSWSFGAQMQTLEDGKWIAHLNDEPVVKALQLVKDLKWEHDVLTADPTAENWATGFQQLGTGAAAMYMAADDAVAQPTANYGLPIDKLMMIGMPAGPAGTVMLTGGNLFVFPKGTPKDEINAALDYLEIMGYAPVVSDIAREGRKADYESNVANGVPVMKGLNVWTNDEYNAMIDELYAQYVNVDPALYASYYEAAAKPGALHAEEPMQTQDMYAELTKALQAVIVDADADPQALLDIAQENFQALLDEQVNK
ncbi:MAG: extracellular solute-binding protein [Oscillospiraceae bacterium]|jgi:ABC-type glycerol-3-phosphate transport system substrate-binding protein|nr:extracellular solute-binding protein [Oscillospiraceae bacterium]